RRMERADRGQRAWCWWSADGHGAAERRACVGRQYDATSARRALRTRWQTLSMDRCGAMYAGTTEERLAHGEHRLAQRLGGGRRDVGADAETSLLRRRARARRSRRATCGTVRRASR